jgi:hypothetical protein
MPRSTVKKERMFRDFSVLNQRYVKHNHLKRLRQTLLWFQDEYEIKQKDIYFMLWAYDLEFWTLDHASQDYEMNREKMASRIVYPLMKLGYIYKHFDKMSPSQTREDHLFRDETKYNYRVRYALSQLGRLVVERFYSELKE